jgi:hypothetical protein
MKLETCKQCTMSHNLKEGDICYYAYPNHAPPWWGKGQAANKLKEHREKKKSS